MKSTRFPLLLSFIWFCVQQQGRRTTRWVDTTSTRRRLLLPLRETTRPRSSSSRLFSPLALFSGWFHFFFFFFSFLLPTWFQFSFLFLFYSRRTPIFPKARLECYLYDCLCFSFLLSIIPSSCVLNGTEEKNKMIINPCVCVCCDWMLNLVVYIASKQPPFLFFFHLLLSTCTTVGRSYVIGEDYNSAGDAEITWIYYMLSEHL